MARGAVWILVLAWLAGPAAALDFDACEKTEIAQITLAVEQAEQMAEAAAAAVQDDEAYRRWFGRYGQAEAALVRETLTAVHLALSASAIEIACINDGIDGCKDGTYAYVYRDEPFRVHLCRSFHRLPAMFEAELGSDELENGTRAGTIIHEVSHFTQIAGTDDHCYSRGVCADMARTDVRSAVRNADSFQYYAEDVAYGPTLAPRTRATGRVRLR